MAVGTPTVDYERMKEHWVLPIALMSGTTGMVEAGEEFLPKHPKESQKAYENRLKQAVLYNFYRKTVQSLVGQSFIRNVVVSNVPEQLKYLENNIDGAHTTITDFAASLLKDALVYGKSHDYTDFPTRTANTSFKDFRKARAYATKLDPRNVIGWKIDISQGFEDLIEVRIVEYDLQEDDDWNQEVIERIKVVRKNEILIYEQQITKLDDPHVMGGSKVQVDYELINVVPNTLGYIPINVTYGEKTGFFQGRSPLEDMAFLNLRHYQSASDQAHILHVARVPFLFAKGFAEGELDNVEIGPNRMIVTDNTDADVKYVEHTSKAIDAGRMYEKDLIEAIGQLGADIVMTRGSRGDRQTGIAAILDQSQSLSVIQIILRGIEESLKNIYKVAGDFMQVTGAENVSVTIGDSMGLPNDPNPVQSVIALLQELGLEEEDIIRELKRRGLVSSALQSLGNLPKKEEAVIVDDPTVDAESEEEEETSETEEGE
jgi:hypothetical protein